jgi:flagellar motor switch protein FliM
MGESFIQSEIDNLLKALSSGELDADDYKRQDTVPNKKYDYTNLLSF